MQDLQFDMFTDRSPMTTEEAHILRQEIQHVVKTANNVRRGLFARLGEQSKLILKLLQEVEDLKTRRKPIVFEFPNTEPNLFRKMK